MAAALDTSNIIKTEFTIEFNGLVRILQDMHKKIAHNSRLLTSLTEDFFQMRTTQDEMRLRMKESFSRVDSQREATFERLNNFERLLDTLPDTYVDFAAFDAKSQELQNTITKQTDRINEVENCTGGKVATAVEKHISRHLRNWYGPVREREAAEIKSELSGLETRLEKAFFGELERTEATLASRIAHTAKLAQQELSDLSEDKDKQLAAFRKLQTSDRSELQQTIARVESETKKAFEDTAAVVGSRFDRDEELMASLYYVLNVKEEDALKLFTGRSKEDGDVDDVDACEDRRVTLMHSTLPFLEMRSKTQRDIRNRLKQSKEEDQDDFSKHIIEIQRDLKKKTDAARVLQMLHDNMDKGLYETVDFLKTRMALMESTKVNQDQFAEAMRTKSDSKVVEQKADRSFVNSLFEFLRSQFEQFQDSMRGEVEGIVDAALKSAPPPTFDSAFAGMPPEAAHAPQARDPGSLVVSATAMLPSKASDIEPSVRSANAQQQIEDALYADPPYQWAAQSGQRPGMPPSKVLKSRGSDDGGGSRPSTKGSTRPRLASGGGSRGVATWAQEASAGADDDPTLPPLERRRQQQQQQQEDARSGSKQLTRAQDAYFKAMHGAKGSDISQILETAPADVYIPESMRGQLVPRPPQ